MSPLDLRGSSKFKFVFYSIETSVRIGRTAGRARFHHFTIFSMVVANANGWGSVRKHILATARCVGSAYGLNVHSTRISTHTKFSKVSTHQTHSRFCRSISDSISYFLCCRVNTSTVELAVEQVMFTDKNRPAERDYEEKLLRVYEADIVPIDFHKTDEAYYEINDYIEAKTRGKILKVVQPEDLHDLQMVLVSAIFFKGEWKVLTVHHQMLLVSCVNHNFFLAVSVRSKRYERRTVLRWEWKQFGECEYDVPKRCIRLCGSCRINGTCRRTTVRKWGSFEHVHSASPKR